MNWARLAGLALGVGNLVLASSLFRGPDREEPRGAAPDVDTRWLEDQVDQGLALFREGAYLEASDRFNRARMGFAALRADPGRQVPMHVAMAPVHWAHAAFALGRPHLASSALRTALHEFPELPAVRYRRQAFYGDRAEYEGAFKALMQRARTHPDLAFLAGYECWFSGRRPLALGWFRAALRREGPTSEAAPFLAVAEVDHHDGVDRVQQFEALAGEGLDRRALEVGRAGLARSMARPEVPICLYRWALRLADLYGRHPEADDLEEYRAVLLRAGHRLGPDLASRLLEGCALRLAQGAHLATALDLLALARRRAREVSPARAARLDAWIRHLRGD